MLNGLWRYAASNNQEHPEPDNTDNDNKESNVDEENNDNDSSADNEFDKCNSACGCDGSCGCNGNGGITSSCGCDTSCGCDGTCSKSGRHIDDDNSDETGTPTYDTPQTGSPYDVEVTLKISLRNVFYIPKIYRKKEEDVE